MLIGCSAALGALIDPLVGVALFAGGLIGAFVWDTSTSGPDRRRPLREAADAAPRPGGAHPRVLVIANRTLAGAQLRDELHRRSAQGAELHFVAPILASRSHYIASDVGRELEQARERLDAALAWARAEGMKAGGRVGDPNAALGAIEDELRTADEVIISTHTPRPVQLAGDGQRRAAAR